MTNTKTDSDATGVFLEDFTWIEAKEFLTPDAIVVLPLGAAAKEHGPHLKLKNDFLIAEHFKKKLVERTRIIALPTLNYHYYPAFVDYPGSTSLSLEIARELVVDICKSIARHGPRRFYVLNTGVSTLKPLAGAAEALARGGILLHYTRIGEILKAVIQKVSTQEGGTHADEIETSLMLAISPENVDMDKAAKDFHADGGALTRSAGGRGTYSPTGIWGDTTLATKEKGRLIEAAYLEGLLRDIEALRKTQSNRSY